MSEDMNLLLGEMGFDSSLYNNLESTLNQDEFKNLLISQLQPILDKTFTNQFPKRKIQIHHDRITFACPECMDSMRNVHAKRGNFILQGKFKNHFKCHNCGSFKRIDIFFKDYNVILDLSAVNYLIDNINDFATFTNHQYDMSSLLDMNNIDKFAIDRSEFIEHFKLQEVKGSEIWGYLVNRNQFDQSKFLYNPIKKYLLILNLSTTGKILGAQKRLFSGNNRFESYKLSKLYEAMNKPLNATPEQIDYLDTLSMIFNICLINFNKPITLFEGPMDAFLYKNSIANTGANKQLPIDIYCRYFYDKDTTGVKKSIEYINKNKEVFLWDRFINDLELPPRKKYDLNDVVNYLKKNNLPTPSFENYFSNDPLDIIDI